MSETYLSVNGIKCAGCVAKAKAAVGKVPGLIEAEFDIPAKSALIKGKVDPQAVIKALSDAGYTAELKR